MSELMDCLILFGFWGVIASAFLGYGVAVTRAVLGRHADLRSPFVPVWIGIAVVLLVLLAVHPVAAIDRTIQLLVLGTGLLLLLLPDGRSTIRSLFSSLRQCERAAVLVAGAGLIGLYVAFRALGSPTAHDTGMYHLPAVEWFRAFPTVPGLANLHGRLGFNNSSFLLASLFETGHSPLRSWHVTNGFFLLLLAARAWMSWISLPAQQGERKATAYYDLIFAPVPVLLLLDPYFASSLSVEVPVAAGVFFSGRWLLSAGGVDPARGSGSRKDLAIAFAALLVLAVLPTLKLSTVAWSGVAVLVMAWSYRDRILGGDGDDVRRVLGTGAALGLVIMGLWMVRGILLSGYLAYPSVLTAVPVEWSVPAEQAAAEQAWIKHFARFFFDPDTAVRAMRPYSLDWLSAWSSAIVDQPRPRWLFLYPLLMCASFGVAIPVERIWRSWRGGSSTAEGQSVATRAVRVLLPAVAGLIFWFSMAPRPTIGFFFVWVLAAGLGTWTVPDLNVSDRLVQLSAVALILVPAFLPPLAEAALQPDRSWETLITRRVAGSRGSERGLESPPVDPERYTEYTTDSGLSLFVPPESTRCWDAPLPCTPHPSENLRLRKPARLGSGFVLEGGWIPRRWPNPESEFLQTWCRTPGASCPWNRSDE